MTTESWPPPAHWVRRARASGSGCPGEADRAVARVDGQNRVRDQRPLSRSRPCRRLNDENSRATFQNVRGDSSAPRLRARGHEAVALDLPGHGADTTAPHAVTMGAYV